MIGTTTMGYAPRAAGPSWAVAQDLARPTVIRIEFTGEASPRTFKDLVSRLGYPDIMVDPLALPALEDYLLAGPEQAAAWARQIVAEGTGPFIILGYCAAAGLAIGLAQALHHRGEVVSGVLVIEPACPTLPEIQAALDDIVDGLRQDVIGPPPGESRRYDAMTLATTDGADFTRLVHAALGVEPGQPADELTTLADQLAQRYVAFVNFLLAATEPAPVSVALPTTPVHLVTSRDFATTGYPTAGTSVVAHAVDVPAAEMMAASVVFDLIEELIEGKYSVTANREVIADLDRVKCATARS